MNTVMTSDLTWVDDCVGCTWAIIVACTGASTRSSYGARTRNDISTSFTGKHQACRICCICSHWIGWSQCRSAAVTSTFATEWLKLGGCTGAASSTSSIKVWSVKSIVCIRVCSYCSTVLNFWSFYVYIQLIFLNINLNIITIHSKQIK